MGNINDSLAANPYASRGIVRDHQSFFGRAHELREIASWLNTMQSVSVIGERRIGKSSLLYQIANPDSDHAKLFSGFSAKYLDLQSVTTVEEFYFRACSLLEAEEGNSHWDLEAAVEGNKIVLCLDEFDQAYQKNFGDDFFNSLRSLAQSGNLALAVATRKPLNELHAIYLSNNDATSNFHNIFNFLSLREFSDNEAREFVTRRKDFSPPEIEFILKLAGNHPYKLNVACWLVFKAKQATEPASNLSSTDLKKIRQEFADQISGALTTASGIRTTARNSYTSPLLALLLILIAIPIVAFSANASFGPGMFFAIFLSLSSFWLLLKDSRPVLWIRAKAKIF
ncbi:MAG: hypothetical protein ACKVZH_13420 [Blastocatellia bacterium]